MLRAEFRGGFSFGRVWALLLRYGYLLALSWPRILDLIYWPAVQMVTWGFIQTFVSRLGSNGGQGRLAVASGTFIGAVMLWDILFRGQLGFSISFLEEMYSRNIGNLLMSPLRPIEFVAALMLMSLIRLAIGVLPVTVMAVAFFGFNLWGLGLALAAFFANLILTSWTVGLVVSGLILRNGLGAEALAWSIMFLLLPLTCVYYPVALLPAWLQAISWLLPPTYVFEGLRALLTEQRFRADLMADALLLNGAYFGCGLAAFLALVQSARRQGSLLQLGE
jgi:ABC-2 type transport system permease protein